MQRASVGSRGRVPPLASTPATQPASPPVANRPSSSPDAPRPALSLGESDDDAPVRRNRPAPPPPAPAARRGSGPAVGSMAHAMLPDTPVAGPVRSEPEPSASETASRKVLGGRTYWAQRADPKAQIVKNKAGQPLLTVEGQPKDKFSKGAGMSVPSTPPGDNTQRNTANSRENVFIRKSFERFLESSDDETSRSARQFPQEQWDQVTRHATRVNAHRLSPFFGAFPDSHLKKDALRGLARSAVKRFDWLRQSPEGSAFLAKEKADRDRERATIAALTAEGLRVSAEKAAAHKARRKAEKDAARRKRSEAEAADGKKRAEQAEAEERAKERAEEKAREEEEARQKRFARQQQLTRNYYTLTKTPTVAAAGVAAAPAPAPAPAGPPVQPTPPPTAEFQYTAPSQTPSPGPAGDAPGVAAAAAAAASATAAPVAPSPSSSATLSVGETPDSQDKSPGY